MLDGKFRASLSKLILFAANLCEQIRLPLALRPRSAPLALHRHVSYSSRGNLAQVVCQTQIEEVQSEALPSLHFSSHD